MLTDVYFIEDTYTKTKDSLNEYLTSVNEKRLLIEHYIQCNIYNVYWI